MFTVSPAHSSPKYAVVCLHHLLVLGIVDSHFGDTLAFSSLLGLVFLLYAKSIWSACSCFPTKIESNTSDSTTPKLSITGGEGGVLF